MLWLSRYNAVLERCDESSSVRVRLAVVDDAVRARLDVVSDAQRSSDRLGNRLAGLEGMHGHLHAFSGALHGLMAMAQTGLGSRDGAVPRLTGGADDDQGVDFTAGESSMHCLAFAGLGLATQVCAAPQPPRLPCLLSCALNAGGIVTEPERHMQGSEVVMSLRSIESPAIDAVLRDVSSMLPPSVAATPGLNEDVTISAAAQVRHLCGVHGSAAE